MPGGRPRISRLTASPMVRNILDCQTRSQVNERPGLNISSMATILSRLVVFRIP